MLCRQSHERCRHSNSIRISTEYLSIFSISSSFSKKFLMQGFILSSCTLTINSSRLYTSPFRSLHNLELWLGPFSNWNCVVITSRSSISIETCTAYSFCAISEMALIVFIASSSCRRMPIRCRKQLVEGSIVILSAEFIYRQCLTVIPFVRVALIIGMYFFKQLSVSKMYQRSSACLSLVWARFDFYSLFISISQSSIYCSVYKASTLSIGPSIQVATFYL